ncbi:hypothetical protein CDD81_6430 [Ophiocordyceps australis]|uniref:Major facilitator superfamily (MFS) profile domain-containing protein n=1 Tax=Ophiocordyceps australis TaxID=1399860 RepID=A0A2C5YG53_9HYPO|nr:hypothetical protein CDD81_6430 [Ophiocordyceps australis]
MAVSYMFQFLDKAALGYAAIMGLRSDLHLDGQAFSWANGIYYIGYLVASYPAALLMIRWRVGKTIATAVMLWGSVLMFTALASNASSLLAVRFLLGVTESPIAPGLTVVIAMWYKREEQSLRHAAWFLGNTTAGILGGLVAYGIGHVETISAWKAVFLIFGGATVAWSAGLFFLLPDVPMSAWFLDKADRTRAVARVRGNMTGIKNDKVKWQQCREAFLDAKTGFIILIQLCVNIPNGGSQSFASIVVEGLGFKPLPTMLLLSASCLVQLVLVLVGTSGSTWLRNTRTLFLALNFALGLVGAATVRQLPAKHKWARYAGYCLSLSYTANFPLVMSLVSANIGGFTKKTTVNALSFIAYCTGNIIGPQLFFAREAPSYTSGFLAMMICLGSGLTLSLGFRLHLVRENRKRDEGEQGAVSKVDSMTDLTDKEIAQFRYVY